ncbi:MAG: hypothetical protein ACOC5S_05900 [Acidobacteriota bacterium]
MERERLKQLLKRASSIDEEYTRLIREATTRPEFLSQLTEYLPRAEGIPTSKDVLGYIAGAPDKLTYYQDNLRYVCTLAEASPCVKVESIGSTAEGREMVAVVLIVPSVEPDGRDKHTDWYYKCNQGIQDYQKISRVPYWGRYAMHDNNRDMITMSQIEMQNIASLYYEWLPVVFQDNHESVPYLFFSSANGPSNFPVAMDAERNLIAW